MSQQERAARLGAKTLFSNMAQGNEFITTKQLEQWLEDSFATQQKSQLENGEALKQVTDSSSLVLGGELISEQHMVFENFSNYRIYPQGINVEFLTPFFLNYIRCRQLLFTHLVTSLPYCGCSI